MELFLVFVFFKKITLVFFFFSERPFLDDDPKKRGSRKESERVELSLSGRARAIDRSLASSAFRISAGIDSRLLHSQLLLIFSVLYLHSRSIVEPIKTHNRIRDLCRDTTNVSTIVVTFSKRIDSPKKGQRATRDRRCCCARSKPSLSLSLHLRIVLDSRVILEGVSKSNDRERDIR